MLEVEVEVPEPVELVDVVEVVEVAPPEVPDVAEVPDGTVCEGWGDALDAAVPLPEPPPPPHAARGMTQIPIAAASSVWENLELCFMAVLGFASASDACVAVENIARAGGYTMLRVVGILPGSTKMGNVV